MGRTATLSPEFRKRRKLTTMAEAYARIPFLFSPLDPGAGNGSRKTKQENGHTKAELTGHVEELKKVAEELRQARRAALNLMEDAIQSKEALRQSEEKYRTKLEKEVEDRTAEVKATKELLQATLDSSLYVIQAFKAVRDRGGKIVDFTYVMNNRQAVEQNGEVIGKSLLQRNPGVVETGLFDKFVQVTESGNAIDHEQFYNDGGFNGWHHQTLVKMGDGFVAATGDINEKRKAREEILHLKDEIAQQATDKYYSLFNSIDEGFCLIEMLYNEAGKAINYRFVEVNESFERHTGLKNIVGMTGQELTPGTEPNWLKIYNKVAETGEAIRFENYDEATGRWYESYASSVGNAESHLVAIVFNDVTERKKAEAVLREREEQKSFLLKLSDAFRSITNPAEIQHTVSLLVMDHLGAERTYYGEILGDQCIILGDAAKEGLPSLAGVYKLNSMPIFQTIIDAGKPVVVRDLSKADNMDETLRELCIQLKVISFINVPVIKNGKAVGVLSILQSTPREWTAFEVELAEEIAGRTWTALKQAKAEEAMRLSEEKYRTLFNSMDEGYCIIQMIYDNAGKAIDWRFCQVNRAFELNNGLHNAEGKTIRELAADIEPKWMEIYDRVAQTGVPLRFEEDSIALHRIFSLYAFRISDPAERKVAVIFTDITERKKAAEKLRTSEERLQLAINTARTVVWEWNVAENKIETTFNFADIFGLSPIRFAEEGYTLVHPDDRDAHIAKTKKAVTEGGGYYSQFRILRPDTNEIVWLDERVDSIEDQDGKVTKLVGASIDITDLKKAEELLRKSEARLRITMESASDYAIITMDTQRRVEKWSMGATQLFGYTEKEMIGQLADIIFTEEDRKAGVPQAEMETAGNTGRANVERWHQDKNGRRFFMSGVMRPTVSAELSGYVKVVRDVTEQKEAQEALRVMEERHRIALHSAEMGAWDWNVDEDQVTWNEQHFRLLALEPVNEKFKSGFLLQFVHEADFQQVVEEMQRAVNETGIYHTEFRVHRADGELRWMTSYGKAVEKTSNKSTRIVGVMYDSTVRKMVTEELSRLVAERTIELQRSNEDLRQFAHVASHDLKEPIRKIQTFNNRILDEYSESLPPKVKTFSEKINTSATRMMSMIDGVLRYSKLGNEEQALEPVDLGEIINMIKADLELLISQKEAVITVTDLPLVRAIPTLMYQLFYNLLLNSLKFAKKGEASRIEISWENKPRNEDDFNRIAVSDNGIGFEQEFAGEIFKTFTRLHAADVYEGSGLGLALCKKIVERHGGSIIANSAPGKGTIFTIQFPRL